MAEREMAPYPKPEQSKHVIKLSDVYTPIGTIPIKYWMPKEVTQDEKGVSLHILLPGFASPLHYFDTFIENLSQIHSGSSAFAVITPAGMMRAQRKTDGNSYTDYSIGSQHLIMPFALENITVTINETIPKGVNQMYFHGHSLGGLVMARTFGQQFGTDGSIAKQWVRNRMGKSTAEACLILHQPAFGIHPDFESYFTEYGLKIKAAVQLLKYSPLLVSAFGRLTIEDVLNKFIASGRIHDNGFYKQISQDLDPETTVMHLRDLLQRCNADELVKQAVSDGFGVHIIRTKKDKLVNNANIQKVASSLVGLPYCSDTELSEELTHTPHLNIAATDGLTAAMKNIIKLQEEREKN